MGNLLSLDPKIHGLRANTKVYGSISNGQGKIRISPLSVLPPALRALEPHEIEDMLRIFKDKFKDRTEKPPSACIQRSWCD